VNRPTSGASGAPAPPRGRSPYLVPLICLGVVAVLLMAAIVVVAVTRPDRGARSGRAGAVTVPVIDPCLVGTWHTILNSQRLTVDGVGPVDVAGQGVVVHVWPDGTDVQDYAGATPYEGAAGGHQVSIAVTGTVRATIRTGDGTIAFRDVTADGTVTATVDGVRRNGVRLTAGTDPVSYTCSGDGATEHTSQYDAKLVRTGASP
jgi:hypothetical protein